MKTTTETTNDAGQVLAYSKGVEYGKHYRKARGSAGFLLPGPTECLEKAIEHAGIAVAFRESFSNGWRSEAVL